MIRLMNVESKIDSGHLAIDYTSDSLIIWGKENAYLAGCVIDIESNKQTLTFIDESNHPTHNFTPYFMSKDKIIVLNSENGSFDLYDLIGGQCIENINLPGI